MFILNVPPDLPGEIPVLMVQANSNAKGNVVMQDLTPAPNTGQQIAKDGHILGVCDVVNVNGNAQANADPVILANAYFHTHDATIESGTAKITTLQQPKHGYLKPDSRGDWRYAIYVPQDGYLGDDSFVMQVEGSGYTVKLKYFIAVTNDFGITENPNPVCGGQIWKISQDPNGTPTLTAVSYQSPIFNASASTTDTAASAYTLSSSILKTLSVDPSSVTFNFANLTGGAVGQTVGANITLDTNAAGNGWFIDTTPSDNSEFLATSNPNEWVAKAGSAAAGKMDMLSVLLHEYGHALGIEHSADSHDFMGTTLTVGVRRLPSAAELALMQQLIAKAKGDTAPTTPDNNPFPGLV